MIAVGAGVAIVARRARRSSPAADAVAMAIAMIIDGADVAVVAAGAARGRPAVPRVVSSHANRHPACAAIGAEVLVASCFRYRWGQRNRQTNEDCDVSRTHSPSDGLETKVRAPLCDKGRPRQMARFRAPE